MVVVYFTLIMIRGSGDPLDCGHHINVHLTSYYDGVDDATRKRDLERLSLCTWAFVRAMKRHLSPELEDEEDLKKELYSKPLFSFDLQINDLSD